MVNVEGTTDKEEEAGCFSEEFEVVLLSACRVAIASCLVLVVNLTVPAVVVRLLDLVARILVMLEMVAERGQLVAVAFWDDLHLYQQDW